MRHADHNVAHALVSNLLKGQVEQRNQAFAAFERKRFRTDELLANEFLENHCIGQADKDAPLFIRSKFEPVLGAFHPLLQPASLGCVVYVRELHANESAIGIVQALVDFMKDFAKRKG